jgi:hypothetical protein
MIYEMSGLGIRLRVIQLLMQKTDFCLKKSRQMPGVLAGGAGEAGIPQAGD